MPRRVTRRPDEQDARFALDPDREGLGAAAALAAAIQNGYSSLRQLRGSSGWGFGARSSSISK